MIVANMATFPARANVLMRAVHSISAQVDQLNIVLNEYQSVPDVLAKIKNVNAVIPHENTYDVGKFYVDSSQADFVFLVDDDISYPSDYVSKTTAVFKDLKLDHCVGGYHCSVYKKPQLGFSWYDIKRNLNYYLRPRQISRFREMHSCKKGVDRAVFVDQIGTGTAVMCGADVPSYKQMRDGVKFTDIRLAKVCWERKIAMVCLPQPPGWITIDDDIGSIYNTFTVKRPVHVANEIRSFAFKNPKAGMAV